MTEVSNLLSGAVGGLLVFGLQIWAERLRIRAECMIVVVGWLDEGVRRIIDLQMSKAAAYASAKPYLGQEEYDANSRALRDMLISSQVRARLALTCGEGRELALFNRLTRELLAVSEMLWAATRDTWATVEPEIRVHFERVVDPLRRELEGELLRRSHPSGWLLNRKRTHQVEGR